MGASRVCEVSVLVALVGCGSVDATEPDAAMQADAPDMTVDSNNQLGPWQTPVAILSVNSTSDDRTPWLSADGLTLYFCSNRTGGQGSYDSWRAARSSMTAPFEMVENVTAINSAASEEAPFVAASGSRVWFSRIVSGQGMDIMAASGSGGSWSAPAAVAELNSTANDGTPMVTANGEAMYMFSRRGANADADIYVATYDTANSMWMTPSTATLAAVNSPSLELYPKLSSDGLRLYLTSNRDGTYGMYVATRTTPTGNFGTPTPIAEINTNSIDGGFWISADERYMILSTNNDLYETRR
jgi:Tol biopolymer transport system component